MRKKFIMDISLKCDRTLGSISGRERIDLEFKEFCLKRSPDLILSDEEIEYIIQNGIWIDNLSLLIMWSLEDYIYYVLPKYITTFSNSNINGQFIIGKDDFGEITGIPFKQELKKSSIVNMIKESIHHYLKIETSPDNLLKNINVQIEQLEICKDLLEDEIKPLYDYYTINKIKYNDEMDKYMKIKSEWFHKLSVYSRKLSDLVNTQTTRQELIEYIQNRNKENEQTNISEIISNLKENNYISIPPGDKIVYLKEIKESLIYWLVKFKDDKVQSIVALKPIKPVPNCFYGLSQMLSKISRLRYRFSQNKEIKFYIIIIDIFGNNIEGDISYKYKENTSWIFQNRIIDSAGQPSSN